MIRSSVQEGSRRTRKRQARTDEIVETAMRLAGDEGLEALTIQRLARELDAAVGALYRYFPSKDALLAALQRRVIEDFAATLCVARGRALDRLGAAAEAPDARLALALLGPWLYWTLPERQPAQYALIRQLVGDPKEFLPDELALPNVATMLELLAEVQGALEAAVAGGALQGGDSLQRTLLLWASLHGLVQMTKLRRFAPDLFGGRAVFDALMRTLLLGWGARPRDVDAALARLETIAEPEAGGPRTHEKHEKKEIRG